MIKSKLIVAAGLACVLAIGAVGCEFKSSSTSTFETSTTSDGVTTTTTTTTTSSTDEGTNTTTVTTTTNDSDSIDLATWENAWMGTSSTGYQVFYAESQKGDQAFLMLSNEDNSHYIYFLGNTENPDTDLVQIDGLTSQFVFAVSDSDENFDHFTMDMGETYGTADVTRCTIEDMISGVREIDTEGNIIQ